MSIRPKITFDIRIAKEGNIPDECEDQYAISSDKEIIALSDGATDATYSKEWAEKLVTTFCNQVINKNDSYQFNQWIDDALESWRAFESTILSGNVPWFTLDKLSNGSAATFLGISFDLSHTTGNHIIWEAVAYGDACLFIVQDNLLRLSFPIESSVEFTNAPPLLRTILPYNQDRLLKRTGTVSYGDKCYLMTDALADWFLKSYERGDSPWSLFSTFTDKSAFESFVAQERSCKAMRNDDVTLLVIEFEDFVNNE